MDILSIKKEIDRACAEERKVGPDRSQFSVDLEIPMIDRSMKDPFLFRTLVKNLVYGMPFLGCRLRRWIALTKQVLSTPKRMDELDEQYTQLIHSLQILNHQLKLAKQEISDVRSSKSSHTNAVNEGGSRPSVELGSLYLNFESQFRSSSSQILKGFQVYEEVLDQLPSAVRNAKALDIGCGRGEWLSFLQERKFQVEGVDSNQAMAHAAKELGIEVHHADGLEYLRSLKPQSRGVVSAFHVVEHLPLGVLLELISECYRILVPGGIAIFETPNPENIIVGSCQFYTDPTHLNPIPPHTLDFLVLQRGFEVTKVIRKNKAEINVISQDPAVQYLLEFFSREQDYAIVAFKK